jgi:hypothetical protein
MQAFKEGSKYFLSIDKKEQTSISKKRIVLTRISTLYTEILDLMVSFSVAHLTSIPEDASREGCRRIYS